MIVYITAEFTREYKLHVHCQRLKQETILDLYLYLAGYHGTK